MEQKDNTGDSSLRQPNEHIGRIARSGRRHFIGIGFGAAVVVISLAGAYAIYGGASDRELNTSSSQLQQFQKQTADDNEEAQPMQQDTSQAQTGTTQQGQNSNSTMNKTDVTVNGQRVEVPANGNVDTTIDTGNSQTRVKVDSKSSSTSRQGANGGSVHNSSNSSVKLNVTSESKTSSQ